MGARCERAARVAFDAFRHGATELVADVAYLDAQIDRDHAEMQALVLRILALRQPVADDLRFLAGALRLITDLERVGGEAVNITERTVRGDRHASPRAAGELTFMAAAALDMLHDALDAFVRSDVALADRVLRCDDAVDRRCASIISLMTAHLSEHRSDVHSGLRVIRVATYLERIADHATNVAEQVIFMVRADDVRHGHWRSAATSGVR